jgi:putative Mn2+ efflux pump MntP
MNEIAVITKWIVAFLIIFLLCMLLIFHLIRKKSKEHEALRRKQSQMFFLY